MIQSNLSQCWCEDGNAQLSICLSIIIVANMFIYYPRRQDLQEQIINGEWWHCELIVARGRSIVGQSGLADALLNPDRPLDPLIDIVLFSTMHAVRIHDGHCVPENLYIGTM